MVKNKEKKQTENQVKKKSAVGRLVDGIADIFLPIVNLLSASGILKGILAILVSTKLLLDTGESYLVLNAMAESVFFFLPMIIAVTAAERLKVNKFTALIVAGVLMYPNLNNILEQGQNVSFLGLTVKGVIYHSSVIPIMLAVLLLHYLEPFLNKIFPEIIGNFFTPLISIFVASSLTLLVFGPMGSIVGDVFARGYNYIFAISPIIAGFLLGAAIQPLVAFGLQWGIVLVAMNNVMVTGSDTILAIIGPAVFAQAGAALAVMRKSQNKEFKGICISAAISAFLGVTEPAIYGVNLPKVKPMIAVALGGGIGGAIAGFSGTSAISFAFPSTITLPVFYGPGFGWFIISNIIGFIVGFVATTIMKFEVDTEATK